MNLTIFRRVAGLYVFLAVFVAAPTAQQKHVPEETTRLIALLQLGPESTVADIGAGGGEMTAEIARQLGAKARVFSTDINEKTVESLKKLVADKQLGNVTVLKGAPEATNLPEACCDAIFVRHVYHHFGNPPAMNASLLASLKPGGRFAVMDFPPSVPVTETVPPAKRGGGDLHGVTRGTVVTELKAAGFEIIDELPGWYGQLFLVLARKPAGT